MRRRRFGTGAAALALAAVGALAGAGGARAAAGPVTYSQSERLAHGVEYQEITVAAAAGTVHGHVVTVDLRDPRVRVDLLTPGAVAARAAVSQLADSRGAVAAVNGDFFDIDESQHPGVTATGSSVGPEIAAGRALKAAVPDAQRFGPALPKGETTQDVLGVGADRRARLDTLTLRGQVRTAAGTYPLGGLDQYALPVGGIGAYTADWGTTSRQRAVCGSDTSRAAGCSTDTYEVAVRAGHVVSTAGAPGTGQVPRGTTVLLGRDAGADTLRTLKVGDRVRVEEHLAAAGSRVPYAFAVGGFPVLRAGAPLAGLDDKTAATRSAAGFGDGGRTLRLLALDGSAESDAGLTVAELATVMAELGCDNAVNLDGGGSTTLVTRAPGAPGATVRNHPTGGAERPVANAIGVLSVR
ncbi:phosphodiester glycosidase family protein [Actinacidiphila epipremni]|uniref:Phosphodiester glycosidase family protein n=1 Tax=Actinacidiphila epipremni TaxID=2053013 RepID=A0ABX0ZSK4_9ACTN|nr:phosphodiester glycosidase family protein [Actinacidiphila epipremni]NJP46968.1 phosphodiester glycosidase family protein [Actinacidiphila epipremni]